MAHAQPGLFAEAVLQHHHLEFSVSDGVKPSDLARAITHGRRDAAWLGGPNIVWSFSPATWKSVGGALPVNVHDFKAIDGVDGYYAPSTQYDVWIWLSDNNIEGIATTVELIKTALAEVTILEQELPAYKTVDSRDPTGFIDGTENPLVDEAVDVALYPEGSIGEGGSTVLIQKWVHNLPKFEAMPIDEQQGVIGRTKDDSVQLEGDAMPPTSHVERNTVTDSAGNERHIYRRNTPFAGVNDETGTLFIGCSNDPALIDTMLDRMFGVAGDGLIDRLIEFSTPVTGSYYFSPSLEALTDAFGPLKEDDEPSLRSEVGAQALSDRSLGIGSLLIRPGPVADDD